ncbi:MAG: OB-fold protein [Bacteroidota bacterium]
MSRNVIYIGVAIILVVAIIAVYFYQLGHDDLSRLKPAYEITAETLYFEFSENEATANEKYLDKVLQVTGILKDMEIKSDSTWNLVLKTSDPHGSVVCSFDDYTLPKQHLLEAGNMITVRGICSGMLMDVLLNNCVLIKP